MREHEVNTAAIAAAREAEILANLCNTVRDLGNLPGNLFTPAILADKAKELLRGRKLTLKVWDERDLKRDKFGGILAVGSGSIKSAAAARDGISRRRKGRGARGARRQGGDVRHGRHLASSPARRWTK